MTQQPQAKYRHDYRAPDYQITDIDLTFDLDAQKTVVTAVSQTTWETTGLFRVSSLYTCINARQRSL